IDFVAREKTARRECENAVQDAGDHDLVEVEVLLLFRAFWKPFFCEFKNIWCALGKRVWHQKKSETFFFCLAFFFLFRVEFCFRRAGLIPFRANSRRIRLLFRRNFRLCFSSITAFVMCAFSRFCRRVMSETCCRTGCCEVGITTCFALTRSILVWMIGFRRRYCVFASVCHKLWSSFHSSMESVPLRLRACR